MKFSNIVFRFSIPDSGGHLPAADSECRFDGGSEGKSWTAQTSPLAEIEIRKSKIKK
jgi:hypothetical protein